MTAVRPVHAAVMIAEIRAAVALMSKGAVVADVVVDLLHLGDILFAPTGTTVNIDRTSFVTPAVGRVTLQQIVMSSQLLSSLKSINVSFRVMLRIRLNQGGLNVGVLPLGTPQRNLDAS